MMDSADSSHVRKQIKKRLRFADENLVNDFTKYKT